MGGKERGRDVHATATHVASWSALNCETMRGRAVATLTHTTTPNQLKYAHTRYQWEMGRTHDRAI